MKKILLILLVCSCTMGLYAQEVVDTTQAGKTKVKTDDSKTKIKDDKGKIKDEDGKMKIKDDANDDADSKTKVKDDKMKIKDQEGKVKVKGEGNLNTNTTNSGMGTNTNTTTTNVNIVTTWEAFPPKPATLPVVGSGVPAEVITTLKNKYGATLYDIKQIKSTSGQLIYVIRVMENGGMRNEYVGADGTVVSQ